MIEKIHFNALFDSINESALVDIAPAIEEFRCPAGQILFEEGAEGRELFIIMEGSVRISKIRGTGEEITLGLLHTGECFGELDLIDERFRSARATSVSPCSLLRMPRESFRHLLRTSPQFTHNLLRILSLRLRAANSTYVFQEEKNLASLQKQVATLHTLVEAARIVNSSLDTDALLEIILRTATSTVQAEVGTLYIVDSDKKELWSKILEGTSRIEIRLPIGKGIAGYVAATGETMNLSDAYTDARFNPEIDRKTGFRTKTVLCMPMKNKDGTTIGVFQLLNKAQGAFSDQDEEFIAALSIHASLAIENAQLVQQMVNNERLSAVGRMANAIIHDIKNPMSVVRLTAQLIMQKSTDPTVTKLADEMIRQIDRFVTMTQEVLDFSRGVSKMKSEEVDLAVFLDTSADFLKRDMDRRNVQLIYERQCAGTAILDQDKMLRAFYNVIINAADAMPDGGTIHLRARQQDHWIMIEFQDTGSGMPPEVMARIFEPFMTHGKKHGTGLGMAIVKKIIDEHKGTIEIESEKGKGTMVRLMLPLVQVKSQN